MEMEYNHGHSYHLINGFHYFNVGIWESMMPIIRAGRKVLSDSSQFQDNDDLDSRLYLGLLNRESRRDYGQALKSIYADTHWIYNLDIVNELHGHSGCVNALR